MAFKLAIVLILAFVAGISAQLENEDANSILSYGEPIVVNVDSLTSDKIETTADRQTRASLVIGSVGCDRLLYSLPVFRAAGNNQIQIQDVIINIPNVRIAYIAALERGNYQGLATIFNGGIGLPNVSIRLQSAVSRQLDYLIEIWGK